MYRDIEKVDCKDCVECTEDLRDGDQARGTEGKVKLKVMNVSIFYRVTVGAMKRYDQTSGGERG